MEENTNEKGEKGPISACFIRRRGYSTFGFNVLFSQIDKVTSLHTPEETFELFDSGASAGYLNQEYYGITITNEYIVAAVDHTEMRADWLSPDFMRCGAGLSLTAGRRS